MRFLPVVTLSFSPLINDADGENTVKTMTRTTNKSTPRTWGLTSTLTLGTAATLLFFVACGGSEPEPTVDVPTSDAVLYEGFRLIAGDDGGALEDATFLVDDGVIQAVGLSGDLGLSRGATRVDLSGKTVMPALVSLHGHPGFQVGLTFEAENYTR